MSTRQTPPEESILTALQELLEALVDEDYVTAVEKSTYLLKRKKALDSSLTSSVQRVLLQSWLQQQEYNKVLDWIAAQHNNNNNNNSSNNHDNNNAHNHKDLALYAHYRLEDYDKVSKSASSSSSSLLEQHLLVQSHFHMHQATPALKVYQQLLNENNEVEQQMEVLTNALAVVASNATPFVPLLLSETTTKHWTDKTEAFLEEHPDYSDLALNLGTLQCLTGTPSEQGTDWLEHAEAHCACEGGGGGDDDDLVTIIQTNVNWSRHFWHTDLEDVNYTLKGAAAAAVSAQTTAIAKLNQAVLDETPKEMPSQPHPKWNALQVRMYWYNRAVLQFQAGQVVECQESCQSLKKTLGAGDASKKSKKKGKSGDNTSSSSSSSHNKSAAILWWESRVDVLLAHAAKNPAQGIAKLEATLERLRGEEPSSSSCPTMDHAVAHVQLHLHSLQHPNNASNEQLKALLKSLPASMQSRPAVVATLEALGEEDNDSKGVSSSSKTTTTNKGSPAGKADKLFHQGQYKEAADLYKEDRPSSSNVAQQLRRVQALTMSDQHDEATKLWGSLQPHLENNDGLSTTTTTLDGEALEQQALPRSSTAKMDKQLIESSSNKESTNKRSPDSVLRRRARKREDYLNQLASKGDYNPDRPSKPNPERWIPKHERSRARRRGQNNANRSAQGGGYSSQADVQRLDAAARRAGTLPAAAASTPSTANLKVASANGGARKGGRRR